MQTTTETAPELASDHSLDPSLQTCLTDLLEAEITAIRALPVDKLPDYTRNVIPNDRMPSPAFMESLSPSETTDTLLACLLVWTLSGGTEVPREFQITASLAAISGKDSVVKAGTGSGKTLAMVIPMLLRPCSMAIVVSPLKRLQSSQVSTQLNIYIVKRI
jgi:ATP-dependent helicase YprA (DUF1998 family)